MIERKDYPVFSYFMEAYMSDYYYTYTENAYFFKEAATKEKRIKLKAEILELKEKEPWEVQAFLHRERFAGIKQKEISEFFDAILNALGNKKSWGGKNMPINIAIDGPAGAGKSTIAKAAAKAFGFIYVDTGALYRAVAYFMLSHDVDVNKEDKVVSYLCDVVPELKYIDGEQHVFVNGEDVSDKIRTPEISMGASTVSAIPRVRDFLFNLQQKIAAENNVVMDGRDIGTVVLPNADVKIYLTASPEERARRRHRELTEKGEQVSFEEVLADVNKRDYNDTHREIAPLKQAEDAVLCDTTDVDLQGAIDMLINIINEKINN